MGGATPPNRGWKDGDSPKPGGGKPHGWKKDGEAAAARPKLSKGTKRLLAAGAVGAVLALLVLVIIWLRPVRPAGLVLFVAAHDTDLGRQENVYGKRDLDDLVKATGNAGADTSLVSWYWPGKMKLRHGPEKFTREAWDRVKWDDVGEQTMIVYLSAPGGADKDGPFLFWESDDKAGGDKRLRLEEVLKRLDSKALEKRNKLLILDPARGGANWAEGMLHNDFVRKLKEDAFQKQIANVPKLAVLCASDVNQRSWVAEEWGQSVFGYFVIEGLKGAADANRAGKVTVGDLHEYVRKNVSGWARAKRDAAQEPILLGDPGVGGADLVAVESSEPGPAPVAPDLDDKALGDAWKTCADLRAQVPSPAVYTPHLWRSYQDTLLRYEQVLRAGDPTGAAGELKGRLGRLQADMAEARRAPARGSLPNALPMPAVLGLDGPWHQEKDGTRPDDQLPPLVKKVVDAATPEARTEAWAEAQRWAEAVGEPADVELNRAVLRLKATDLLLRQLADGRPVNRAERDRARELLRVVEGGNPDRRPAAAQLLVMLARRGDLHEPPADRAADQARAVGMALRVALLAERVALATEAVDSRGNPVEPSFHPYSEAVFPWIKGRVEKADGERFAGENLLFFADPEDWKKAEGRLKQAEDEYKEAARDAAAVREALRTRDEVLAELPYYAHWLARRRLSPDPKAHDREAKELGELLVEAEKCWGATHELAARLEAVPPKGAIRGEQMESLEQATKNAVDPFDRIKAAFNAHCEKLKVGAQVQERWQQIEDVLSVPLEAPGVDRIALLEQAREIGKKLAGGGTQQGAGREEVAPEEAAREQAQREGRMAVAALGKPGLDDRGERLLRLVTAPEREQWQARLTEAGADIGTAWRKVAGDAGKLAGESGQADDYEAAGRKAVRAAGLCRLLEGAAAGSVPAAPYGPVVAERRWRLHDLLLWQAGRTLADHWYAEGDKADPYYLLSGQAYAADAATLAEVGDDAALNGKRQARARKLKEEELKRTGLKVGDQPPLRLTSEPAVKLSWKVEADAGLPPGDAAVWPEASGKVALVEAPTRHKVNPWPEKVECSVRSRTEEQPETSAVPTLARGAVTLHGLYRGQRIAPQVEVTVQRAADIVVTRYPEKGAGLAFRAHRSANEAKIAIVLDASGSMNDNNKYKDALQALKKVLSQIPEDTTVSIWRFGTKYKRDPATGKVTTHREQVFGPKKWANKDTEEADRIDEIMAKLDVTPDGASPIAETMFRALEEDLQGAGLKTLLVLTDGDDNESPGAADAPTYRKFHENLREKFRGSGAFLNVILFGDPTKAAKPKEADAERQRALKQFRIIEEDEWKPRARLFEAADKKRLDTALEQALIPRVQLLRGNQPAPEAGDDGLPIIFGRGHRDENLTWSSPLAPDLYEAVVYNTFGQKLRLHDGDRMAVMLRRDKGVISYERALYAEDTLNDRRHRRLPPRGEERDWVSMMLLNRLTSEGNLDLIVTLEDWARRAPGPKGLLEQHRPGFQWVEVRPRGGAPGGLRWHNEAGYPAPAWRLTVPGWPEAKSPEVRLWWTPDLLPPVDTTLKRDLSRDPPQDELKDLPLQRQVHGQEVTVESVTEETRTVREPGAEPRQTACLVMRISHAPGQPVWARLEGHESGEEHYYYGSSNKYAAIFWDVTAEQAKKLTLHLTAVEAFKAQAQKANCFLYFRDLDRPSLNESVPAKPVLKSAGRASGGD